MVISESDWLKEQKKGEPDAPRCAVCKTILRQDYASDPMVYGSGGFRDWRAGSHCPACGLKYSLNPDAPEWQYRKLSQGERGKIASERGVHVYEVCCYCGGTPPHNVYNEVWKCDCGNLSIGLPIKVGGLIDHGYDVP